jgi:hypothetical protein
LLDGIPFDEEVDDAERGKRENSPDTVRHSQLDHLSNFNAVEHLPTGPFDWFNHVLRS